MKARENIRLWFEFYKLALNDPKYAKRLEGSRSYYENWGDCRNVKFGKWWKEKKHLFDEVTVREIAKVDNDQSAIYLKVPLNLPITDILKRSKDIIAQKQAKLRKHDVKSTAVALGSYFLTPGAEFRASRNYHVLLVYRDVYLKLDRPPINQKFLAAVQQFYSNRKKRQNSRKSLNRWRLGKMVATRY
jgi:hypothetical protein